MSEPNRNALGWPLPEQSYRVEYYYMDTPRHVRHIEAITRWIRDTVDGWTSRALAWCDSKKTRHVWPNGEWGEDLK